MSLPSVRSRPYPRCVGRQARFRCSAADAADLEAIVSATAPVTYLAAGRLETPVPVLSDTLKGSRFVLREADLTFVEVTPMPDCWVVNALKNPLLDYSPGHDAEGQPFGREDVRHGRLYVATGPWLGRDDARTDAPAGFAEWADEVLRLVRSRWKYVGHAYEGPEAHALLNRG